MAATEVKRAGRIAYREALPDVASPGPGAAASTAFPRPPTCGATCCRRSPPRAGARSRRTCSASATRRPTRPATWERQVEALERFRSELGLERGRSLVVHDWGGLIGLALGLRPPRRGRGAGAQQHRVLPRRAVARDGEGVADAEGEGEELVANINRERLRRRCSPASSAGFDDDGDRRVLEDVRDRGGAQGAARALPLGRLREARALRGPARRARRADADPLGRERRVRAGRRRLPLQQGDPRLEAGRWSRAPATSSTRTTPSAARARSSISSASRPPDSRRDSGVDGHPGDLFSGRRVSAEDCLDVDDRRAVDRLEISDPDPAPSIDMISTRWSPIGFGRWGERVPNTPCRGLDSSPRGCTERTLRSARSSHVRTMTSSPIRRPSRASSTSGSKTSDASGAPSSPCFGAAAGSISGDSTLPIADSSIPESVIPANGSGAHANERGAPVGAPRSRAACPVARRARARDEPRPPARDAARCRRGGRSPAAPGPASEAGTSCGRRAASSSRGAGRPG